MATAIEPGWAFQEADDGPGQLTSADHEKVPFWDNTVGAFVMRSLPEATVYVDRRGRKRQGLWGGGGTPVRIQSASDGPGDLGAGDNGKALVWNNATGRFEMAVVSGGDADTLDGLDSTDFALDGHTHPAGDATTLDGLDSTAFALSSHSHPAGDATTLDGIDSTGFALVGHSHAAGDATTLDGLDSTAFLLASGATTGATSQAQAFTSGITTGTGLSRFGGVVVLPNTVNIRFRNGANAADINFVYCDSNNEVQFGSTGLGGAAVASFTFHKIVQFTSDFYNFSSGGLGMRTTTDFRFKDSAGAILARIDLNGALASGIPSAPTAFLDAAAGTATLPGLRLRNGVLPTTALDGVITKSTGFHFWGIDSNTNTIVNMMLINRQSSGTPTTGFGSGIVARLESSTTIDQDAGRLTWEWAVATHATRASRGKLSAYYTSTERECIAWEANATVPLIGFLGTAPVAKPAAYTPTNVSADRSYDANATTVDELADVLGTLIADLQAYGLLA